MALNVKVMIFKDSGPVEILSARQKSLYEAGYENDTGSVIKYFDDYVEDVLSYMVGVIERKFKITDIKEGYNDNPINVYEDEHGNSPKISDEHLSFIVSITEKRVFKDLALTEKQYGRLSKIFRDNESSIKELISSNMYDVVLSKNVFIDIAPSVSYENRISFVGANYAAIQFNYNKELIEKIKQVRGTKYNWKHKVWVMYINSQSVGIMNSLVKNYGFEYDMKMKLLLDSIDTADSSNMIMDYSPENTICYGISTIASSYEIALAMNDEE